MSGDRTRDISCARCQGSDDEEGATFSSSDDQSECGTKPYCEAGFGFEHGAGGSADACVSCAVGFFSSARGREPCERAAPAALACPLHASTSDPEPGSYGPRPCECDEGFRGAPAWDAVLGVWSEPDVACVDVDECSVGEQRCVGESECVNNVGSFVCECRETWGASGLLDANLAAAAVGAGGLSGPDAGSASVARSFRIAGYAGCSYCEHAASLLEDSGLAFRLMLFPNANAFHHALPGPL